MKINKIHILLFAITLVISSCAGDSNSNKEGNNSDNASKIEKTNNKNKVKPTKAGYFIDLKNEIGLSDKQLYDVKVIISRTGDAKKKLMADGNWEGEANKKVRDEWRNGQRSELRNLLGQELFKKKLSFDNQYFQAKK